MIADSVRRILAMFIRYLYLHKRSLPRIFEVVFWPVMSLLVWGFVTVYISSMVESSMARVVVFLINGMIFWDILYRSQQAVTISVMEEISQQNILNILVSPLRMWEWLTATFLYSLLKSMTTTLILCAIALSLYKFNLIHRLGLYVFPLAGNLLLFGFILGIYTSGLLMRWGHSAEALIWGIPFLLQPLSAIYYPIEVLPSWLQAVSRCLPSTYVFEGMRAVLSGEAPGYGDFFICLGLNGLYFVLSIPFFLWLYRYALTSGRLVRHGMD